MISRLRLPSTRFGVRKAWVISLLGALGVVPVQGQATTIKLKVAAVQFRSSFDVKDNVTRIRKYLGWLGAEGVQVAVFPECALTGYYQGATMPTPEKQIAAAEEQLGRACRRNHIAAVVGSVYKVNGHAYDTADLFDSSGKLIERYGKIYLAERWDVPGNHIAYFDLDGVPSTVIICHDERFPELVRLPAIEGARILYYISSESSLKEPSKLAPYRAQMMARAVENGMFVVAANAPANPGLTGSHGQSRIIAADGNIIKEAGTFGEDVLISTILIKARNPDLQSPSSSLRGPLGDWWRSGVEWMIKNRNQTLQ